MVNFEACNGHCPDMNGFLEMRVDLTNPDEDIRKLAEVGMDLLESATCEDGPEHRVSDGSMPMVNYDHYVCRNPNGHSVWHIQNVIRIIKQGEDANGRTNPV